MTNTEVRLTHTHMKVRLTHFHPNSMFAGKHDLEKIEEGVNHRHLNTIDCLMALTACLFVYLVLLMAAAKKIRKEGF
jgi:hypothetical protein